VTRFTVRLVGESEPEDENGVYTLGVADSVDPSLPGDHVEFQRAEHFDEQDVRLGWSTYCIITHGGDDTHYGGALSWGMNGRMVVIRLDEEASANLEIDGGFCFDLCELDDGSVRKLESGLSRILVGVPRDACVATSDESGV
jgi:Immunity protein 10